MNSINNRVVKSQKGFTLIELLAVMAIIAILAAIVAPAVSGTKDAGADAQAGQDALQVRTAASQYFSDQETVEVVTQDNAITTLGVSLAATNDETFDGSNTATSTITSTIQTTSSRWPETFITSASTSTAVYYVEIPTPSGNGIGTVYFVDKVVTDPSDAGRVISGVELLTKYTAVDVDKLVEKNYLEAEPQSANATKVLGSSTVHTLIWLLKKTNTPGTTDQQGRDVRVFKLTKATENSGSIFDLTYERIF